MGLFHGAFVGRPLLILSQICTTQKLKFRNRAVWHGNQVLSSYSALKILQEQNTLMWKVSEFVGNMSCSAARGTLIILVVIIIIIDHDRWHETFDGSQSKWHNFFVSWPFSLRLKYVVEDSKADTVIVRGSIVRALVRLRELVPWSGL